MHRPYRNFLLCFAFTSTVAMGGEQGPIERTINKIERQQELINDIPKEKLLSSLRKKLKEHGYHGHMDRHPDLFSYLVDVLKHPTALVNLLRETSKFQRLRPYLYWFLSLLVLGFILKRKNRRRKVPWRSRFVVAICLNLAFMMGNLMGFYFVFRQEFRPFIELAMAY